MGVAKVGVLGTIVTQPIIQEADDKANCGMKLQPSQHHDLFPDQPLLDLLTTLQCSIQQSLNVRNQEFLSLLY